MRVISPQTVDRPLGTGLHKTIFYSMLCLTLLGSATKPAFADKSATSISLKVGYFNAGLVKASCPEGAESELLKNQADAQLRHDVQEGNDRLQKAITDKKSPEEIAKIKDQLQTQIDAKQQALVQIVQTSNALASEKIAQAVNSVAKDKGLDVVIDGGGVYAGAQRIVENGVDITQEIVEKLKSPSVPKSAAATK